LCIRQLLLFLAGSVKHVFVDLAGSANTLWLDCTIAWRLVVIGLRELNTGGFCHVEPWRSPVIEGD
jgi:hypothetical protein